MWGFAFCLKPRHWGWGWTDMFDVTPGGQPFVVGRWFLMGPLALTWEP